MRSKGWMIGMIFVGCGLGAQGQGWLVDENTFETNWNLSLQAGTSALFTEIKSNFSGMSNQMNNLPGWAFHLQLAKMAYERFDIGADAGMMQLKGISSNPNHITYLNNHPRFFTGSGQFKPYPIFFQSQIISLSIFAKYNFINFSSFSKGYINLNLYIKGGIGAACIVGETGYQEKGYYPITGLESPLYAINCYGYFDYTPVMLINTALGIHYQINKRVFVSAELSVQAVGSSLVNALPNYKTGLDRSLSIDEAELFRQKTLGFTGKFMMGATYFFNFNSTKKKQLRYLPFYHNRYRSYYSKYQTTENNRIRKTYHPFYTKKLKDKH